MEKPLKSTSGSKVVEVERKDKGTVGVRSPPAGGDVQVPLVNEPTDAGQFIQEAMGAARAHALWKAIQDGGFAGPDGRLYEVRPSQR